MFIDEDNEAAAAAELTKQTLVDTQARMGMMLDLMPMGLLIHTQQGIIFSNQEACRLLQVSHKDLVGRHFLDFLQSHGEDAGRQMELAFDGNIGPNPTEADLRTADGSVRTIKLIAGSLPWDGNPVIQLLLQDITDLKEIQEALRRLTITDELTGAFNRRHAFAVARSLFDEARSQGKRFSIAVMDIDHFKQVNDTFGHAAGDAALRVMSAVVQNTILSGKLGGATFARVGGEEFALLFPNTGRTAAFSLCELLRRTVETQAITSSNGTFAISVSIGVAELTESDNSFDSLFSNADRALYLAKSGGRNRVCVDTLPTEPEVNLAKVVGQ